MVCSLFSLSGGGHGTAFFALPNALPCLTLTTVVETTETTETNEVCLDVPTPSTTRAVANSWKIRTDWLGDCDQV